MSTALIDAVKIGRGCLTADKLDRAHDLSELKSPALCDL